MALPRFFGLLRGFIGFVGSMEQPLRTCKQVTFQCNLLKNRAETIGIPTLKGSKDKAQGNDLGSGIAIRSEP